ncbi:FAD binding domain-containing protein [Pseudomonas sp. RW409]|uniref:FAD binding domain-containing protein n=1 Tax=Pseudomonas sp. RW409 TaxID=2202895 RepID=UPI000D738879|nr:FAD binding domain-containing protein [Pseudomonas sp. RW409]PWY50391.1 2-polyprenyl-6-methoxyphenol hydroxylase [Pseudomonas sp. RW409]
MPATRSHHPRRAIVIGGSLGGLFAGNLLHAAKWDVELYERSAHDLDSRGGGIVLQPEVVEALRQSGRELPLGELGVRSEYRTVFRPDGSIRSHLYMPQVQTSWSLLYTTLRDAFGPGHYHRGQTLAGIDQSEPGSVSAVFDSGHQAQAQLLLGADGGSSTVRRLLWPDSQPSYAGYVAWRGLVPERAVPAEVRNELFGTFGFANHQGSHILGYLVPGTDNDLRPGHRLYNWVWYRVAPLAILPRIMTDADGRERGFSVPEGRLAPAWRDYLIEQAEALLPPQFRAVVQATQAPFVQAIRDLAVEQMVERRVVLLGDAAAIPRPHTAASTSKAATNALALAAALRTFPNDLERALRSWQPAQLALGQRLRRQGTQIGNHLLFNQAPSA